MKPRLQQTVFSILVTLVFTACSTFSGEPTTPVQVQPAISIAKRQGSILTPAGQEGEAAAVAQDPQTSPEAETSPVPESTAAEEVQPTATWTEIPPSEPTITNTIAQTNTQPPPTTAPSDTPSPTDSGPVECSPSESSAFAAEVIQLINELRDAAGIPLLTSQSQLTGAAQTHSNDMTCNQFFSHTSPTTGSLFERLTNVGYSYSWAGENIAAGHTTPAAVIEAWMASEGHRANILNENFSQIGVGYASWDGSEYGTYWTAVFASP
jgi:uncharacterized protein YkwD